MHRVTSDSASFLVLYRPYLAGNSRHLCELKVGLEAPMAHITIAYSPQPAEAKQGSGHSDFIAAALQTPFGLKTRRELRVRKNGLVSVRV